MDRLFVFSCIETSLKFWLPAVAGLSFDENPDCDSQHHYSHSPRQGGQVSSVAKQGGNVSSVARDGGRKVEAISCHLSLLVLALFYCPSISVLKLRASHFWWHSSEYEV